MYQVRNSLIIPLPLCLFLTLLEIGDFPLCDLFPGLVEVEGLLARGPSGLLEEDTFVQHIFFGWLDDGVVSLWDLLLGLFEAVLVLAVNWDADTKSNLHYNIQILVEKKNYLLFM